MSVLEEGRGATTQDVVEFGAGSDQVLQCYIIMSPNPSEPGSVQVGTICVKSQQKNMQITCPPQRCPHFKAVSFKRGQKESNGLRKTAVSCRREAVRRHIRRKKMIATVLKM